MIKFKTQSSDYTIREVAEGRLVKICLEIGDDVEVTASPGSISVSKTEQAAWLEFGGVMVWGLDDETALQIRDFIRKYRPLGPEELACA